MLEWLFGSKNDVIIEKETIFSRLPIGQEFQKLDSESIYIKTTEEEYETIRNSWHCTKWYRVHEDFLVRI
jgi:hypothetical protein